MGATEEETAVLLDTLDYYAEVITELETSVAADDAVEETEEATEELLEEEGLTEEQAEEALEIIVDAAYGALEDGVVTREETDQLQEVFDALGLPEEASTELFGYVLEAEAEIQASLQESAAETEE